MHHCSLPYHWQYKGLKVDVWNSFGAMDNLALEKVYCDVNAESRVNFKPAQPLEFSLLERQVLHPSNTITMQFTRKKNISQNQQEY